MALDVIVFYQVVRLNAFFVIERERKITEIFHSTSREKRKVIYNNTLVYNNTLE